MPKTPKGRKRPVDVIGNAVHVMRIATGELDESEPRGDKDPSAVALGRKGGLKGGPARKQALSARRRTQIAKRAARVRWGK